MKEYNEYVVFILGRSLLTEELPIEDDRAYECCVKIAREFEKSDCNITTKALYTCVEEYINENYDRVKELCGE